MKHLRQYIRRLLKESAEEVANVMQVYDAGNEEQAVSLAYMMGPEFGRHPDLQIWRITNATPGEWGQVVIEDLNYDQAMDPKYQAFAAWDSGYIHTEHPDRKNNPWGNTINGASARKYPPSDLDFKEAADTMREEGWKTVVDDVDEEAFTVGVKLVKDNASLKELHRGVI